MAHEPTQTQTHLNLENLRSRVRLMKFPCMGAVRCPPTAGTEPFRQDTYSEQASQCSRLPWGAHRIQIMTSAGQPVQPVTLGGTQDTGNDVSRPASPASYPRGCHRIQVMTSAGQPVQLVTLGHM